MMINKIITTLDENYVLKSVLTAGLNHLSSFLPANEILNLLASVNPCSNLPSLR